MTPSPRADDAAIFWRRGARRTALRYNLSRVLGIFLSGGLGLSAVFACALLVVRQHGGSDRVVWIVYGASLFACVIVSVRYAGRKGFCTAADALVRLEWHLGLHNRLSAAAAGVGIFPPPRPAPDGYTFRWQKILPPLAGALGLMLAAAFVPVTHSVADFVPETPPLALSQTADWLDTLKKTDLVQEPALEDFHERLEQLQQQPARDWYSQSSLEAGDNLHGQTEQSLQALQRDLRTAASSLETMEHATEQTTPAEAKAMADRMQEAFKGLELGNLPLNRELLSQLKRLDPSSMKNLTPEELEKLKERLKNGVKITEAMLRPAKPGEKPGETALALLAASSSDHDKPGVTGGGTSSSPLNYRNKPTELGSTATEPVTSSGNLDHALPGDIVGVGKGEHTVDPKAYAGPTSAGAVTSDGSGGEAVWRDDLTPQEREVLKNFYK